MLRALIFIALTLSTLAVAQDAGLARGWYLTGSGVGAYQVTTTDSGSCGGRAARIASRTPDAKGPIGLVQSFRAENYRGKRVRYSATVNVDDVQGWAGLFFRVDDVNRKTLTFDDMRNRPFRGTRKCAHVSVVVSIPAEAEMITLGVNQQGQGATELSDINVETVDGSQPETNTVDSISGRIDDVWFTDALIASNLSRQYRMQLHRRAPGQWSDAVGDATAIVDGDVIRARLYVISAMLEGAFQVERDATTLRITGEWGSNTQSYPLTITVTDQQIDMTWGFYERHLRVAPAWQLQPGCRFFSGNADSLEVCGAVFSTTPPPVPVLMAFLMNGFRKATYFRRSSQLPYGPSTPTRQFSPVPGPLETPASPRH